MTTLTRSDFGQQYLVRMDAFVLLKKMIIINTDRATLIRITTEFIELLGSEVFSRRTSPQRHGPLRVVT